MSMMKMYVTGNLYLNTKQVSNDTYIVHLTNGETIEVVENPKVNGMTWLWKVDGQYFNYDDHALNYLKCRISEKLTGYRIFLHRKMEAPSICGIKGGACRNPGKCNTALCCLCPIAEAFFAKRDGLKVIYAVGQETEESDN